MVTHQLGDAAPRRKPQDVMGGGTHDRLQTVDQTQRSVGQNAIAVVQPTGPMHGRAHVPRRESVKAAKKSQLPNVEVADGCDVVYVRLEGQARVHHHSEVAYFRGWCYQHQ